MSAPPPGSEPSEIVSQATVSQAAPLAERVHAELSGLLQLSPLSLILSSVFVLFVAWVLAWGGPAMVRTVWRLGIDPRRRLGLGASGLRIAGLLVGYFGLLHPVLDAAPVLGIGFVVISLALAGLIAPMQLRNLASGLSLATRSRLREGDFVTIAALEGTVLDIGLLRVSLRTVDGGVTHVPAADFEREAVTVGSRRAAVPIEARVIAGPGFDELAIERLRRALWLSPYRRASTEPRVSIDVETGRVEVRIDTWAATSTAEVERHLRALLLEMSDGRASQTSSEGASP